jgi:hypothetical protein
MKPEEFILWLNGYLDGLENNLPQGKELEVTTLSPGLVTIKQKLSQVGKKIIDFNPPTPTVNPYIYPPKYPYETYCGTGTGTGNSTTVTYDFTNNGKTILKG